MPLRIDSLLATFGRAGAATASDAAAPAPAAGGTAALPGADGMPLVLHVLERRPAAHDDDLFKLLAQMPPGRYRHAVLALTREPLPLPQRCGDAVQLLSLDGGNAPGWAGCLRLYRLLRQLKPDVLHAGSLRALLLAAAAGVRIRLPNVTPDAAVGAQTADTADGLAPARPGAHGDVRLAERLRQRMRACLSGGRRCAFPVRGMVDCTQFHPRLAGAAAMVGPPGFLCDNAFVIGAAGAMDDMDGQAVLVQAFLHLVHEQDRNDTPLRLLIAGDGPCRERCRAMLRDAGASHLAWLPGARDDTARLMRSMDVFVATEPAGGTPRVLEAMASGLPVVAIVAGTGATGTTVPAQAVQAGWTGSLVPAGRPDVLADAIACYCRMPGLARRHGQRARRLALTHHSLATIAARHLALYDQLMVRAAR